MKILVALCLGTFSIALWAQDQAVEIQPKVQFITLPNSPLKWISQTITITDQLREVVLQNVTGRSIVGFQLGWVIFIPQGCGVTESGVARSEIHVTPYQPYTVPPEKTVTTGPYHLPTDSTMTMARHAHSPVVVAQVGVVRVRFSDGGETIYALEQEKGFAPETVTYPCQANETRGADLQQTFASEDGVFRFNYSDLLVRCREEEKEHNHSGWWVPEDSCEAYIPICDDPGSQASSTIVCFAYPKGKFVDAPTFNAGTFSVAEIKQATTEKDCLTAPPDWVIDPRGSGGTATINGVKFKVFQVDGAAMSHTLDGHVYRNFHENKCYELSIRIATTNPGAYDPGTINEFSKEDWNEVYGRLKQALDSFKFLK